MNQFASTPRLARTDAMKILLCVFVLSFRFLVHAQDGECKTPDNGVGICKRLNEDKYISEIIRRYKMSSVQKEKTKIMNELLARKSVCIDNDLQNKYCAAECFTPTGESGVIKSIHDCPPLMMLRNKKEYKALRKYWRPRNKGYCCGPDSEQQREVGSECDNQIDSPPVPGSKCCGIDIGLSSRILGGKTAGIYEYPWMVHIDYKNKTMMCGGSLITNRHVVTAAHCLHWQKPTYLRIGEYNIANPGKDCNELPDGTKECTDGAVAVQIESYLKHPDYDSETAYHDIALIKLRNAVKFTAFVRPICLPSTDHKNVKDQNFIVAGWGKGSRSSIKQFLGVNLFDFEVCNANYNKTIRPLGEGQLCAGGERRKDSCHGDSGGPLMADVSTGRGHYELAGVVSFGLSICGLRGVPGVYTNVYRYVDWIQQNVNQDNGNWKPIKK